MEAYGESGRVMRQLPIGNVEIYLTCFLPYSLFMSDKVHSDIHRAVRNVVDSPVWALRRAVRKSPMEKVMEKV